MKREEHEYNLKLPFHEQNEYLSQCISFVDVELSSHNDRLH